MHAYGQKPYLCLFQTGNVCIILLLFCAAKNIACHCRQQRHQTFAVCSLALLSIIFNYLQPFFFKPIAN
jgi:hypothetical protein